MPARRGLAGVLMALALVAAACGDSGTTTTVPTTGGTTSTAADTTTTLPPVTTTTTTSAPTTTTLPPITVTTLPGVEGLSVSTVGLGGLRVGLTVEEAEEATGLDLVGELDPDISEDCYFVTVDGDDRYEGVLVMIYKDQIGRVEIVPPSQITTRSGAGIGMPADDVRALFPGRIEQANEYTIDGEAIAYVPADEIDAEYRVVFVIDQGVVGSYRAGILPPVGFGEGCV